MLGSPQREGKSVRVGKRKFNSIQDACSHFNLSRYKLMQRQDFRMEGNL